MGCMMSDNGARRITNLGFGIGDPLAEAALKPLTAATPASDTGPAKAASRDSAATPPSPPSAERLVHIMPTPPLRNHAQAIHDDSASTGHARGGDTASADALKPSIVPYTAGPDAADGIHTGLSFDPASIVVAPHDVLAGHGIESHATAGVQGSTHAAHHAAAASATGDPSGQLWFGADGPNSGTSTGSSDNQIGHIDSDAGGRDVADVDTQDNDASFEAVGLDTAAGLYFAMDDGSILRSGHITNDTETDEASQFSQTISHQVGAELQLQYEPGTNSADYDEVESFAVDPVHHLIFVGLFGQSDTGTGILELTYDPTTGVMTSPYNSSNGTITDTSHVLLTNTSSGGAFVNATAMYYDMTTQKLYYIDQTNGTSINGGANETWNATNGIYVTGTSGNVGASNAPTPSELTLNSQFAAGDGSNYISAFVVDDAKGLIYFAVNHPNATNVSLDSTTLYWMPITGGTATSMSLPGGVSLHFASFEANGSNAMALDTNNQQLYIADAFGSHIIQLTLSGDGKSFASGINNFMVLDSNNTNTGGGISHADALYFDNLPTLNNDSHALSGTTTEAVQGGSALTALTGAAITVTDPDGAALRFATVEITNAQAGDILGATTGGTSITASYNSTTDILTLSGDDSYAHYQQVLNSVTFQDSGTDNTTGSHPTRDLTWTISDGVTIANPTATDPNVAFTTLTIDRAPTLGADSYSVLESASSTGTSGTAGTGVFGNDSDKDGDSLTVSAVNGSGANVGSGTFQGTYGHFDLAANGSFTYNADNTSAIDAAATGSHPTDSFTYSVSDGHGGTTTQTVTFTIDRAPTLGSDSYNVVESSSVSGTSGTAGTGVLGNDSDKDGDSLTVSAVNGSGGNVGSGTFQGTYGHFDLAANGSFTYSADNTSAIDLGGHRLAPHRQLHLFGIGRPWRHDHPDRLLHARPRADGDHRERDRRRERHHHGHRRHGRHRRSGGRQRP